MLRWVPYTFVRTAVFFIGGIFLAFAWPELLPEWACVALAGILAIAYFWLSRRTRVNPGWIALALLSLLGYTHLLLRIDTRRSSHLIHIEEEIRFYRATISRFPEEKTNSWRLEARVDAVFTNAWENRRGNVLLYFPKEHFTRPFRYGDVLLINGSPTRPKVSTNPHQFDFAQFLSFRNIFHQHRLRGDDVLLIGHQPDNPVEAFAYRIRERAVEALRRFVTGSQEGAIAFALVLGVTDALDADLIDAYSATGAMHILAVSGMHISLIYLLLLRLLAPLNKRRTGRWMIAVISLAILWLYALITGLSPSVLRAVVMFSFLAIARPWSRTTNAYNTLAVSALCMLIWDPYLIFSVGFQLSYVAVLGIIHLYRQILTMWEPQRVALVEIWKVIAVSLAAQAATFPLGLLYFHQFPNYFLLANLLVVPLSSAILVGGLILVGISFSSILASGVGWILTWAIRLLNGIIFTMEDLPFAVSEGIYISVPQVLLLFAFIAVLFLLLEKRKYSYVIASFMIVFALESLQWWHFFRDVNVRKLVVYDIPGHTAVDMVDRGRTYFVADDRLLANHRGIDFYITPNRVYCGATDVSPPPDVVALPGGRVIAWGGRIIVQVTGKEFRFPENAAVDCVVVSNNAFPDLRGVRCRQVILDSSNSFLFATRFLDEAKLHKLVVHSVLHQGAFVQPLDNRNT